ncbi:MAG: bifunctional 2-polyprenyl-6-hydroxyphenol methylase/3-demethylubiquinol 3-O-methyltransferase UbiG, partial [Thermodesulfobacteriota bacterium]
MQTEAQKFDAFKRDWWDPKGRLSALHDITPLRFDYFEEKAEGAMGGLKGKRVLDVGCGGGLLSERFAVSGAVVTGIDLSPLSIEAAKEHAESTGLKIDYRVSSAADLFEKEKPKPFDCVICAEVLEHVDDLKGFIKDSLLMLRPGGLFFFSTISKTLKARFFAIFVAEDILGMVHPGTHDYGKFIRPSVLAELLRENSVELEGVKGMSFDPLR